MKHDIETLRNSFELGYQAYKTSYDELKEIESLYHNKHYTQQQLNTLHERQQPAETFNIIKMMDRAMMGYFSTVINSIKATPLENSQVKTAERFNKALNFVLRDNDFSVKKEDLLLNSLHSGLLITNIDVAETSNKDKYNRAERKIGIHIVDPLTAVLDPKSQAHDYSDARFIHVFKWLSTPEAKKLAGRKFVDLEAYSDTMNASITEYEALYGNNSFNGRYKVDEEYLIIHTVSKDDNGVYWSIYWAGETLISRKKIPYNNGVLPYRVVKLHKTLEPEFYGIYREVINSQHAINQALLQIQQLVNTKKVIVQDGAVEDKEWENFKNTITRVNGVLKVSFLEGIKFIDMSSDIVQQYRIIENGLERIKQLLHVNDSFLGNANASDSGRKVNMQRTSSIVALRYVVTKLEFLYKLLGLDIIHLIDQYYNSEMVIPSETIYGENEFETYNSPIMMPSKNEDGSITEEPMMDYEKNEDGSYTEEPINHPDKELSFDRLDIMVHATNNDEAAEADKLMLQQTIQGPIGQFISQADPMAFLEMGALEVKQSRVKHSEEISEIILKVAKKLQQAQMRDPRDAENDQAPGQGPGGGEVAHTMGLSNEIKHPNERGQ